MSLSLENYFIKLTQLARRTLVFLAKGPAYHYTYIRWRLEGWWQKRYGNFENLNDLDFFAQLDLDNPELTDAKASITKQNYELAKAALVSYYKARVHPRFHFTPESREYILAKVAKAERKATLQVADEICLGVFRFRHMPAVKFESMVNWTYHPAGNTDWTWDLNRHAYFITLGKAYWYTGDEKYAEKFVELLLDWIDQNPAGVANPNWDSVLEVAIRLNAWIWSYFLFQNAQAFNESVHITFLKSLLTHAHYLTIRLEYHAANNHLLLEAKALAFCGLLFPEFKEAKTWQKIGLRVLWREIEKQVCEDGTHAERAPMYHRGILSELLDLMVFMDRNNFEVPEQVLTRFERMFDFEAHITKPDGTLPLFGDSALTDVLTRFSPYGNGAMLFDHVRLLDGHPNEEMVWLLNDRLAHPAASRATVPNKLASQGFPQGGYFIMRAGEGIAQYYLAFDCGPFGYKPAPVHGHADALSFELYAGGHSLIHDAGVYSYHIEQDWRHYFRGTRAHNTVLVDNEDQSTLLGHWHVFHPAQATLHQWASKDRFDFVDGSHNGYLRLHGSITHRRQVFFAKPEYWIITDSLLGSGEHQYDLLFHLPPGAEPKVTENGSLTFTKPGTDVGLIISPRFPSQANVDIISGATDPIQGWVSLHSGERLAAPVAKYTLTTLAPVHFCTILHPYALSHPPAISVTPLEIKTADNSYRKPGVFGVQIRVDQHTDYWIIDQSATVQHKAFANCKTDSSALYLRTHNANPTYAVMLNGSELTHNNQSLLKSNQSLSVMEWQND